MLTSKFSTDFLLIFSITCMSTVQIGRCQYRGRPFDSSRHRQREPVENRSYPRPYSDSNFRNPGILNNRVVSTSPGQLNNQNRFGHDHRSRGHVAHNTFNDQSRTLTEQYTHPYVSLGNNRLIGPRSQLANNADSSVNGYSNYLVDIQPERLRDTTLRRVTSDSNSRNNIAGALPYRREIVPSGRHNSRNDLQYDHRVSAGNRPTFENSQTARVLPRQLHHRVRENQRPGHPQISGMYTALLSDPERSNQNLARRLRDSYRPRIRAERNEVFQYRTSVRRTPQSSGSNYRNVNEQERFTGYPAQSLSLPFEPLSLRYRGLRESKLAEQQQRQSNRIRNIFDQNARNTQTINSGPQPGQTLTGQVTDALDIKRNITFQPRVQSGTSGRSIFLIRNADPFGINGVDRRNSRLNGISGQNENVGNRNKASNRVIIPFNRGHLFPRTVGFNGRLQGQNSLNSNILPHTRMQDALSVARRRPSRPRGGLHELFGISRTGLENALKSDSQQADRTPKARNKRPEKSSTTMPNSRQWQLQLANNNNRNKEKLIADITKSLEIADKLDLMGLHRLNSQSSLRISPNENLNKESMKILNGMPDGFLPLLRQNTQRHTERDDDTFLFDTEDGFIDS